MSNDEKGNSAPVTGRNEPRRQPRALPLLQEKFIARDLYMSVEDVKEILRKRGLVINDQALADHYLATVGHNRMRQYHRAFYKSKTKEFHPGTKLEDVVNFYAFERRLRMMILGPLEKIEVAMRALLIDSLGGITRQQAGKDTNNVINLFDDNHYNLSVPRHRVSYRAIKNEGSNYCGKKWRKMTGHSRRKFRFEYFTAWQILQYLSFGSISKFLDITKPEIITPISRYFGVRTSVLRETMRVLTLVRNSCAHHEPIWDATFQRMPFPDVYLGLAGLKKNRPPTNIYEICALIHVYLGCISEKTTWHKRLMMLFIEYDPPLLEQMGFPEDWMGLRFWRTSDVRVLIS